MDEEIISIQGDVYLYNVDNDCVMFKLVWYCICMWSIHKVAMLLDHSCVNTLLTGSVHLPLFPGLLFDRYVHETHNSFFFFCMQFRGGYFWIIWDLSSYSLWKKQKHYATLCLSCSVPASKGLKLNFECLKRIDLVFFFANPVSSSFSELLIALNILLTYTYIFFRWTTVVVIMPYVSEVISLLIIFCIIVYVTNKKSWMSEILIDFVYFRKKLLLKNYNFKWFIYYYFKTTIILCTTTAQ